MRSDGSKGDVLIFCACLASAGTLLVVYVGSYLCGFSQQKAISYSFFACVNFLVRFIKGRLRLSFVSKGDVFLNS